MRVGDNKRYFRIEDEPFFPVGQNLESPYWGYGSFDTGYFAKPFHWDEYYGELTDLKNNGANYFRYLVCPWSSEIEFEEVGNYSTENRMAFAWEFDRLLDTCKSLDMRMHYNMQIHYAFEAPSLYTTFFDWIKFGDEYNDNPYPCSVPDDEGYCYRNFLDSENPTDFFSSQEAQNYYKKRLRYMIARWGYSTNIAVMELYSEVNNFGNVNPKGGPNDLNYSECKFYPDSAGLGSFYYRPYVDSSTTYCPIINSWQESMCQYIKDSLYHTDHPLAVNYTGPPNDALDPTYQSPYVDVATYNNYGRSVEKAKLNYDNVEGIYHDLLDPYFIPKPFMHSEYGPGEGVGSIQQAKYKKALYYTPFIGLAGSGINWDWQENEFGVWSFINPIREFMEGIPLDEENWIPGQPVISSDNKIEVYFLRSEMINDNRKVAGVIGNRTYNYYTQSILFGDTIGLELPNLGIYEIPIDVSYFDLTDPLIIPNVSNLIVSPFQINWYNAQTGLPIDTTITLTNASGELELEYPVTLTGTEDLPIIFFEAFQLGSSIKILVEFEGDELRQDFDQPILNDKKEQSEIPDSEMNQDQVFIYPNPTKDQVQIKVISENWQDYEYELVDNNGRMIDQGTVTSTNFTVDLSVYQRGVYIFKLRNGISMFYHRIVKV